MEHFDADGRRDFLYYRDKENNGIIQRFIGAKVWGAANNKLFQNMTCSERGMEIQWSERFGHPRYS